LYTVVETVSFVQSYMLRGNMLPTSTEFNTCSICTSVEHCIWVHNFQAQSYKRTRTACDARPMVGATENQRRL